MNLLVHNGVVVVRRRRAAEDGARLDHCSRRDLHLNLPTLYGF